MNLGSTIAQVNTRSSIKAAGGQNLGKTISGMNKKAPGQNLGQTISGMNKRSSGALQARKGSTGAASAGGQNLGKTASGIYADTVARSRSAGGQNLGQTISGMNKTATGKASGPIGTADSLERKVQTKKYTVQKGDNLTRLAKRYNTTVENLVKMNKGKIKDPNLIYTGDTLVVKK
jgi:LysM repeat protein